MPFDPSAGRPSAAGRARHGLEAYVRGLPPTPRPAGAAGRVREDGRPSRAAAGVTSLPDGAVVEMSLVVALRS
jgi:enamine deaminase RidA (YjgF/YER057c/UK114 family)